MSTTAYHRQNRATALNLPAASSKNGHAPETVTLESLLPDLRRIASLRSSGSEIERDDLLQSLAEDALSVQRQTGRMESRGYHRRRAWHRAADTLRSQRAYRRYVAIMPTCVDEDGMSVDLSDVMPAPDATPEERVMSRQALSELRASMTYTQWRILELLLQDYPKGAVADTLGVSPNSVTRCLNVVRARLKNE